MPLKTILLSAASALVLSASAAFAAPATAASDVHMRSGPGTNFDVIATIPGGAIVDAGNCSGGWCQVSFNGESGYTSGNYLDFAGGPAPSVGVAVAPSPGYAYYDDPYYDDYYDYGYGYGPGVGIYLGGHRGWHGGHGWNGGHHWNGGHAWNGGRPHGNNNPGAVRQGFAGPPASWQRPGTGIGGRPSVSAPTGMHMNSPGVFRGGAGVGGGMHAGGAIGGGGRVGGAPAGGGAHNGFAGSIIRH
jgi:hypothetical protein